MFLESLPYSLRDIKREFRSLPEAERKFGNLRAKFLEALREKDAADRQADVKEAIFFSPTTEVIVAAVVAVAEGGFEVAEVEVKLTVQLHANRRTIAILVKHSGTATLPANVTVLERPGTGKGIDRRKTGRILAVQRQRRIKVENMDLHS